MPHVDNDADHLLLDQSSVLVFDIDDTLYLERSYVRSGFDAVGRYLEATMALPGLAEDLWLDFIAGVRGDAFNRALLRHGIEADPKLISTLVEVYRTHFPTIDLAYDAHEFLGRLNGRRAAAITDGPGESQRMKVAALGLERYLNPILVTAELGPGLSKPHHRAFQLIEDAFDVPPSRCIYIGDNPTKDFIAPLARGWTSIRVRRAASLHQILSTPPGVVEITSLAASRNASG